MCRKKWEVGMTLLLLTGLFMGQFWGVTKAYSKNLARDLFPESKLVWEKEFDGRIMDIQVGGESIVIFKTYKYFDRDTRKTVRLREDWDYCVSCLDSDGNVLWKKWFKEEYSRKEGFETIKGRVHNISVSRDGKYVVINQSWGSFPDFLAQCYNDKGELVWQATCEEPGLTLSPYGRYAISTRQEGELMMSNFIIVDNKGKQLWSERRGEWTAAWLDDSTVALAWGNYSTFVESLHTSVTTKHAEVVLFDTKSLQEIWKVDIGKALGNPEGFGIHWYTPAIKASNDGKFIAVAAEWYEKEFGYRAEKRTLCALDNKGSVLWDRSDFVTMEHPEIKDRRLGGLGDFSFTEDSKHLIAISVHTAATPLTIDLFDAFTGKRKWRKTPKGEWFWTDSWGLKEMPSNIAKIIPIYHADKVKSVILLDKDRRRIQLIQLGD